MLRREGSLVDCMLVWQCLIEDVRQKQINSIFITALQYHILGCGEFCPQCLIFFVAEYIYKSGVLKFMRGFFSENNDSYDEGCEYSQSANEQHFDLRAGHT